MKTESGTISSVQSDGIDNVCSYELEGDKMIFQLAMEFFLHQLNLKFQNIGSLAPRLHTRYSPQDLSPHCRIWQLHNLLHQQ